ncbi:hypothetical protein [Brachyspira hampsonii]|uniref:hypothetical protein n=1 Tax=Brachyspira hampsonii TaxID=1287055 RepID=UPI00159F017E|nr:hypothetical protein [Brachyspira hampsonii]
MKKFISFLFLFILLFSSISYAHIHVVHEKPPWWPSYSQEEENQTVQLWKEWGIMK